MPLTHKEILKILNDFGFVLTRQKGSHQRFEKNGYGITVGYHKEFPPKTAKSMLKDICDIIGEDLSKLLKKYKIKL